MGLNSLQATKVKVDGQVLIGGDALKQLNDLDFKYFTTVDENKSAFKLKLDKKSYFLVEISFKVKPGRA